MLKTNYLILGILLIGILVFPATAYAVDLSDIKVKTVVVFEYPDNINKLRSDYNKDLSPVLETLITNFGTNNNFTGYSWRIYDVNQMVDNLGQNETSGNTIYSLYPKVLITGINSQSEAEFNTQYDILLGQMRQSIIDFLQSNGGSNVITFINYSWGNIYIDETF